MGMDFSVYIGSAITITKTPTKEEKTNKTVCSSDVKHKLAKGDFCPICGSPKINKEFTKEVQFDLGELWEDFEDDFYWDENTFMENGSKFSMRISEDDCIDTDLDLSKFNLDKFRVYAKDFLKALDKNKIEYKVSNIVRTIWS
jgi:hypothetical protein